MADNLDTQSDTSGDITDMDAEPDSDVEQDLDQMLGTWLGELETMTKSIDVSIGENQSSSSSKPAPPPPSQSITNIDNFSFSAFQLAPYGFGTTSDDKNTLPEDEDVDLDALLGDLCKMEIEIQQKIDDSNANSAAKGKVEAQQSLGTTKPTMGGGNLPPPPPPAGINSTKYDEDEDDDLPLPPPPMNGEARMPPPPPERFPAPPMDEPTTPVSPTPTLTPTTPTPPHMQSKYTTPVPAPNFHSQPPAPLNLLGTDNGNRVPGVSITASSPSPTPSPVSPSALNMFGVPAELTQSVRVKLKDLEVQLQNDASLSEEEKAAKLKSEKIKIALEKLKKARVQKLIVRVYMEDGSSKTMFVDETMTVRQVSHMLVEKNHLDERPDWSIIEQIPDLFMERALEDHEHLVTDVMLNWKRETTNRILFQEKRDKYAIFKNPQNFLLSQHASEVATQFAEKTKQSLIDEFFNAGNRIPEMEGFLYLKQEGKKSWKKHFFVLRGSGLYYCPKGKSKSSKDIVCLVQFEHINVYAGVTWKKKYKAPTDHCFALKHPQIQQKSKYIKYVCAEDYRTCQRWVAGIRLAKYNKILLDNYNDTQREMAEYASSAESMSQSSSLTDTASLSSMQSSSSSQSSTSLPATHGLPHAAPLVLPHMSAQYRKSSMGNMFSNAWKKGQEAETPQMLNRERSVKRSASLPSGKILDEDSLDNRPLLGNQNKAGSGNAIDMDVEKALQDLESEITRAPSNNPTPQPQPPVSTTVAMQHQPGTLTTQAQGSSHAQVQGTHSMPPQGMQVQDYHPYTHTATTTKAQQDGSVYGRPMTYTGGVSHQQPTSPPPQNHQEIAHKQQRLLELQQQQQQIQQELEHQKLQLQRQLELQQKEQQQRQHQQMLEQQRQQLQEMAQQRQEMQERSLAQQRQQELEKERLAQQRQQELEQERLAQQRQQLQDMQQDRKMQQQQHNIQRHVSFERPTQHVEPRPQVQLPRQMSLDRAQQQPSNVKQNSPVFLNELNNVLKPKMPPPTANRQTVAAKPTIQQQQQYQSQAQSHTSYPPSQSYQPHYATQSSHPPNSHPPSNQSYSQPPVQQQSHSQMQQAYSQQQHHNSPQHQPHHSPYPQQHQQSPSHARVNIRDKPPPSPKPSPSGKIPPPMSPKPTISPRPTLNHKSNSSPPFPVVQPKPSYPDRPQPMSPKPAPKPNMKGALHMNNGPSSQASSYTPNYGTPMSPSSSLSSSPSPSPSPSASGNIRPPQFPTGGSMTPPQKGSRPPPPPKRSETTRLSTVGSPTKGKKVPPLPPQRTT